MGGKIGLIIFIIILAGVGLYLITSGAIANSIAKLNSLISTSSTASFFHFGSGSSTVGSSIATLGPAGPQPTTITPPPSSTGASTTGINPSDIPSGYTAPELSKYFHQIRLGSISAGNSYTYGTITLNAYLKDASGSIDITGWQIKSRNSGEYLPQAINLYEYSGSSPASDILMRNNDTAYLYSSSAPFNLRFNKCIGYVAHVANFVPALPLSCPYVNQSQIQNLSGQCQNYINSISACQAPNMSSPQISQTDYSCQDYLNNNFTYKSCFTQHANDPDFFSNQIWVWMGSNVVDPYHDTVLLLDRTGLLVDEYKY